MSTFVVTGSSSGIGEACVAIDDLRPGIDTQERVGVPSDRVAAAVQRALTASRSRYRYVVGNEARAAGILESPPARAPPRPGRWRT